MVKNKMKKISENIIEFDGERYVKEDSKEWLDIPELKISVEIEVHDKDRSWDDLGLSEREDELLTSEEVIWLANSKYAKQLKMDGSSSKDDFFFKQPFDLSRKNGYVARFCAGSDGAYLGCYWGSSDSGSDFGVRFVRRTKGGKKTSKTSKTLSSPKTQDCFHDRMGIWSKD